MAILDDLEQIAALLVIELLRPPVVKDEELPRAKPRSILA